jgi:nicotinamidase-related amidase
MPLLARESLLLVVDLQQKLAPAMEAIGPALAATATLMKGAALLDVPILVSEQYPKGLGPTLPEIAALAPAGAVAAKMHFSAAADPGIAQRLRDGARRTIVLAGIETHVCVLQTALDLRTQGFRVAVAADATASRRAASKALALERMARRGVDVVNAEMCLFEWLGSAHHPAFKAVSALIR